MDLAALIDPAGPPRRDEKRRGRAAHRGNLSA